MADASSVIDDADLLQATVREAGALALSLFRTDLKNWILQQQQADQDRWKIDSTPSFVINGQKTAGEMSYDAFRKLLPEV